MTLQAEIQQHELAHVFLISERRRAELKGCTSAFSATLALNGAAGDNRPVHKPSEHTQCPDASSLQYVHEVAETKSVATTRITVSLSGWTSASEGSQLAAN